MVNQLHMVVTGITKPGGAVRLFGDKAGKMIKIQQVNYNANKEQGRNAYMFQKSQDKENMLEIK